MLVYILRKEDKCRAWRTVMIVFICDWERHRLRHFGMLNIKTMFIGASTAQWRRQMELRHQT